ncbi:MAG: tryptophan--tRNA ligase [Candidatus Kerfeldbacteria bacterium]|nr:tryptophan--tRNA ligase [Candidatus Kerfeldbacteria bacterium]
MSKRILSGIQPTGHLHLGNYIGAVRQWIELQHSYESLFCIVDLHAITVRQKPEELRAAIRRTAAGYLACGVDPEKASIFVQSSVAEHAELAWVLNTFTQMGELERMTQYKDKSKQHAQNINAGLFTYPALMAADVLLYKTELVPVGEDQKQHIELIRNLAQRFNNHYDKPVFTVPEYVPPKQGARIMGLDDPTKKMSKSAESEWNAIALTDTPDVIRKKIKRAVTDSESEVRAGDDKPALTNLLTIYSVVTGKSIADLEKEYVGRGYGDFKTELGEAVVAWITPIQEKMATYMNDAGELDAVLDAGAERARAIATQTLKEVYDVVGLGY